MAREDRGTESSTEEGTASTEGRGSTERPEAGGRSTELGLGRAGVGFGEVGKNFPSLPVQILFSVQW